MSNTKRILCMLVAVCMLLAQFPAVASASEITFGDSFTENGFWDSLPAELWGGMEIADDVIFDSYASSAPCSSATEAKRLPWKSPPSPIF